MIDQYTGEKFKNIEQVVYYHMWFCQTLHCLMQGIKYFGRSHYQCKVSYAGSIKFRTSFCSTKVPTQNINDFLCKWSWDDPFSVQCALYFVEVLL